MVNLDSVKLLSYRNLWNRSLELKLEGRGQRHHDVDVAVHVWVLGVPGTFQLSLSTIFHTPFSLTTFCHSFPFPHHGLLQRSLQNAPIDSGFRVRLPKRK
jgi:hypothetical protein